VTLAYDRFDALTFDCYGTLIDWEAGLLGAFAPVLARHGVHIDDEELLVRYAAHEARLEAGPFLRYRDVLGGGLRGVAAELGVLTNCDDDLFAASNARLGVTFDWVVTAEQVGSYKPAETNFQALFERVEVPRERILHVAQSRFHDHAPAKRLGMTTVWIDRRHDRPGAGATPEAAAAPDATYPDMASFAAAAVAD
jgi:2-haloacid dehalogenase